MWTELIKTMHNTCLVIVTLVTNPKKKKLDKSNLLSTFEWLWRGFILAFVTKLAFGCTLHLCAERWLCFLVFLLFLWLMIIYNQKITKKITVPAKQKEYYICNGSIKWVNIRWNGQKTSKGTSLQDHSTCYLLNILISASTSHRP